MRRPRIHVTPNDRSLSKKRTSVYLAKKIREDMLLAKRAKEAEECSKHRPRYSFEEVWNQCCT